MLPYLYYRGGPYREFTLSDEDMHARQELMGTVTPTNIVGDAEALLAIADADPAARDGTVGAVGFCMSGGLACRSPGRCPSASPRRRRSTAPGSCATPTTRRTSVSTRCRAEVYFAWCDNDATAPPETIPVMREAHSRPPASRYTLDFIDRRRPRLRPARRQRYDRRASELHWERVHSLLRRNL